MVPSRSAVGSRQGVDLSSPDGTGTTIPLVVANMTAIAGRRMAETVARRGGLVVIPQDIPIEVVTEVVSWVKGRHLVLDTPIVLAPHQTVADALALLPKRAHNAGVVVDEERPPGRRGHRRRPHRRGPLHPAVRGHVQGPAAPRRRHRPREAFNRLDAANRRYAPAVDADGRLAGILTRKGALRATLYTPATDGDGRLRIAAAVGHQRRRGRQGQAAPRRGRRHPRHRHRARPPGVDDRRRAHGARARPARAHRGGQHRRRRGRQGPDRRRRRHHQGRGRPRRHVHDPHDDGRRPAAVLRGPGVLGGGDASTASTCGPTEVSATRATSPWRWPPVPPTS